jgi:uncharacterized membrane protein YdbT with pleckstrin-like domain
MSTPSNPSSQETTLWTGRPSLWANVGPNTLAVIAVLGGIVAAATGLGLPIGLLLMAIGGIIAISANLGTLVTKIRLTSERLLIETGIFNRKTEEIELYRVCDRSSEQPLLQRILGLQDVTLDTEDRSAGKVHLRFIPNDAVLNDSLRTAVEAARQRNRTRMVEIGDDPTP